MSGTLRGKGFPAVLLLASMLFISGCWNYIEVNNIATVAGVALDRDKITGKILMTVEFIKPEAGERVKFRSEVLSTDGDSLTDASRNLTKKTGLRVYWGQVKLIVISKDIAREGLVSVLDVLDRDPEMRGDVFMAISQEATAGEIFEKGTVKLHDTITYHINDMLKNERNISKFRAATLSEVIAALSKESSSPLIPAIQLASDKKEKTPQISGSAVFEKDKLAGWLNEKETMSIIFAKPKGNGGIFVVPGEINSGTTASLEIFGCKAELLPEFINNQVVMRVNIVLETGIAELSTNEDFISHPKRGELKENAEELIKNQVKTVLLKCQKDYHSDILGFSEVIKEKMPAVWQQIKPDWERVYSTLDTQVNVKVNISRSAIKSRTVKVGD